MNLDGSIAEVIEDHIREHRMDPKAGRDDPRAAAAEELVERPCNPLKCTGRGARDEHGLGEHGMQPPNGSREVHERCQQ